MDIQKAERNIFLQSRINFFAGVVFLVPVITLLYQHVWLSLVDMVLIANASTIIVWVFEVPTSVFADTSWRKKSLLIAVLCNFFAAFTILFFPTFVWFMSAAIFSGLYWSFWSGTGQAFLEENLRILGKEKEFWKRIGHLMALENLSGIITPLIVACILKYFVHDGYTILALLDLISACILIILTWQLHETPYVVNVYTNIKDVFLTHIQVAKQAFKNVFMNKKLRLLLIYRSLANHVAFFYLVSLPIRVAYGMEPWLAGVFWAVGAVCMLLANKYAYKLWETHGYRLTRVASTIAQGGILVLAGIFLQSWIAITILIILFNLFEWLRMPAWNHVLVEETWGIAIATTRSIIFSLFALYTTLWKQILVMFPVEYALICIGVFILCVNFFLAKKMLATEEI
jgi:MFS family permease